MVGCSTLTSLTVPTNLRLTFRPATPHVSRNCRPENIVTGVSRGWRVTDVVVDPQVLATEIDMYAGYFDVAGKADGGGVYAYTGTLVGLVCC